MLRRVAARIETFKRLLRFEVDLRAVMKGKKNEEEENSSSIIDFLLCLFSLFLLYKQNKFYIVKIFKEAKIKKISLVLLFIFNSLGIFKSLKKGFQILKKWLQKNDNER